MIDANTGIYRIDDKVKFFGLIPEKSHISQVQLMLERIENKSPAFSSISVNFFRDGENYHGEILITSGERIFVSKEMSTDFTILLTKLEKKMARKLRQWRQIRSILPNIEQTQNITFKERLSS